MKQTIEDLLFTRDDKILTNNDKAYIKEVFLQTLKDYSTREYLDILSTYIKARRKQNLSSADISRISGVPEITVLRFENLQSVPQTITLMKILNAVGLELRITVREE